MDVKYIPEDWEKTKEGIGELVGSGWLSKGAIENLKKLDTIIEKATGSIMRNDEDKVVHLPYKSQKGKYQELQKDYEVLHNFSGKVGELIDTEIDQPFYEDMDAFAVAMRDLTIDKYETSNTIGAKETIITGSYGQTAEHIKDKIKVSDIFSSNNFFMTSLKAEFDAYKKENPKENMSYETYQQRRLNSRAFNYESIEDKQEHKEFWRDVGILGTTLFLAGATVFFPPAGAALFAFTASVGVMEVSSAVTGKDWLTGRKLDTNERWLRGVLGFVDVAPIAKGLHAFGNVTTGLKSGVSTTTIKGASKVGLEEGGSRLKQADNLITERAQNVDRLSGEKFDNLSLNIEKKTPVENAPVSEKKSAEFFDGLNLKGGQKLPTGEVTGVDWLKQLNLQNSRETMITDLSNLRKDLLKRKDVKNMSKICVIMDTENPSLKGIAGSGNWQYNPTVIDHRGIDPREFCKIPEDYTKYYRSLLSEEYIDSLPDSFFIGKNKEFIREDMAKLRASIDRVKDEATELNRYDEPSFEYDWNVDNCAEIWSARDAILKGARYDNFIVRTENLQGGFAEPCDNCSRTFLDFYNIDY
ncbi:pre-toxin TG domain-containing protein [Bacillus sp. NPDC077411]|uniref:pre-toxin TG domain-containing protein n=1 Tax=Bacillus sp. NPDC077411 TaxID=3363947 RepID=UPI0037C501C3